MLFTCDTCPGPPTALHHSTFEQSYLQHPQISHVSGEMEHVSESPSRTTRILKFPAFIQLDCSLCLESEIFKNVVLDPSQSQIWNPWNGLCAVPE